MTTYSTLMTSTDEQVVAYVPPADAKKFFTRIRKVSLFVRTGVDLVTEFDEEGKAARGFSDMGGNVPVSTRVANKMMDDLIHFSEMKNEKDGVECKVKLTRLGGCLFIG